MEPRGEPLFFFLTFPYKKKEKDPVKIHINVYKNISIFLKWPNLRVEEDFRCIKSQETVREPRRREEEGANPRRRQNMKPEQHTRGEGAACLLNHEEDD